MTTRRARWHDSRERLAKRKPWIRLDSIDLTPSAKEGGYQVVIRGFNLHASVVPPRITVDGIPLEKPIFQSDGRQILGYLPYEPESKSVFVDYGFAKAKLEG